MYGSGDKPSKPSKPSGCFGNVLSKYEMDMSTEGFMGEGSFCSCRRAKCLKTGRLVAVKFFKSGKASSADMSGSTCRRKFKRQILVMKELARPLVKPEDDSLWTGALEKVDPERLFVQLVDYSQDENGNPSVDMDGGLYIAMELAQYSLRDFLRARARKKQTLSKESTANITKAIILIVAGLHAKGYVHLDLKPENMMIFDGWLKLIDLDGCVKKGTKIEVDDPTISFSPCYCAPEWATWLLDVRPNPTILAAPSLDAWSVGCTICELILMEAVMKKRYASFLRRSRTQQEAGLLYLEWLGSLKQCPVSAPMREKDRELIDYLEECLLVCQATGRQTCAQSLSHKYFRNAAAPARRASCPVMYLPDSDAGAYPDKFAKVRADYTCHLYKGLLWKLNTGKDANDAKEWLQHDMWIASNMSFCYYSLQEQKSFVLLDAHKLYAADIAPLEGVAREFAFQIRVPIEDEEEEDNDAKVDTHAVFVFAGVSAQDMSEWLFHLNAASQMDNLPTVHLGESAARELQAYKVTVKNRRLKVRSDKDDGGGPFDATFRSILWKVKGGGNRMQEMDWFKRECWLSRNNHLIYWSPKENCELIYYTSFDIGRAEFKKIPNESSLKPWTFQIRLPPSEGIEFAPGEFAAESNALREQWLAAFSRAKDGVAEWCPEYTSTCIESALRDCCSFDMVGRRRATS